MSGRDLYEILGLNRGATDAEIKKAYRRLAHELHPDRNPDDDRAEERFKQVSHAYRVLSDPRQRKMYDELGEAAVGDGLDPARARGARAGGARGFAGFGSFGVGGLEDLFGGRAGAGRGVVDFEDLLGGRVGGRGVSGQQRRRRTGQGRDVETDATIGFVEALRGCEKDIAVGGARKRGGRHRVRARIPAGVRDGEKVRLRGQGGAGVGRAPDGDLVLRVRVQGHPVLWREEDDLHLRLPVTPLEAHEGARVPVPTLDGEVTLTIPAGTASGAKLRLRGKGAPRRKGGRGDLIAHVQLRLPDRAGGRVTEVLEELDELYESDIRAGLKL